MRGTTGCSIAARSGAFLLVAGCSGPEVGTLGCDNGSTSPGCGAIRTDLRNQALAIGITNNSGDSPNGVPLTYLHFNEKDPALGDEPAIVSVAVPPRSIEIDGRRSTTDEWRGVPSVDYALTLSTDLLAEDSPANPQNLVSTDHGIYAVTVWSAYDDRHIYFKFRWADATRNDVRGRWTYTPGGWARNQGPAMRTHDPSLLDPLLADRAIDANEDRLFLMFNKSVRDFAENNGCAGLCHLGPNEEVETEEVAGTLYHVGGGSMRTSRPDEEVDLWHWKATRSAALARSDDKYIGCGTEAPDGTCSGNGRRGDGGESEAYRLPGSVLNGACNRRSGDAGRHPEAEVANVKSHYVNERFHEDPAGECLSLGPSRRPTSETPATWMFEAGSPFIGIRGPEAVNIESTDTFEVGHTVPGFIHRNTTSSVAPGADCHRCSVAAEAIHADGSWTLELKRTLTAPDPDDVDFVQP